MSLPCHDCGEQTNAPVGFHDAVKGYGVRCPLCAAKAEETKEKSVEKED